MLRALEEQLRETSTALDNVMSAIEQGVITKSTKERLLELEDSKEQLEKQIALERAKAALAEDEHTIAAYFECYADADLDDPRVRDGVLDYFIDKIYVYDDGTLDLVGWFTSAHDTLHVSLSDLDGDMMRGIHGELEEWGDDDGGVTGEDSGLEFEPLSHGPAIIVVAFADMLAKPLRCFLFGTAVHIFHADGVDIIVAAIKCSDHRWIELGSRAA